MKPGNICGLEAVAAHRTHESSVKSTHEFTTFIKLNLTKLGEYKLSTVNFLNEMYNKQKAILNEIIKGRKEYAKKFTPVFNLQTMEKRAKGGFDEEDVIAETKTALVEVAISNRENKVARADIQENLLNYKHKYTSNRPLTAKETKLSISYQYTDESTVFKTQISKKINQNESEKKRSFFEFSEKVPISAINSHRNSVFTPRMTNILGRDMFVDKLEKLKTESSVEKKKPITLEKEAEYKGKHKFRKTLKNFKNKKAFNTGELTMPLISARL